MILIQVELANISIVALAVMALSVAPAVLGFVLGLSDYAGLLRLKIPSCFVASAEIVNACTQICGIFWPYQLIQIAVNCAAVLLLLASGLYYICVRVEHITTNPAFGFRTNLERAFVCLWAISLLAAAMVTLFSLGAAVIAIFGPEDFTDKAAEEKVFDTEAELEPLNIPKKTMLKKPGFKPSVNSLGSPVDIPVVQSNHRPRLSWPSTMGSIRSSESFSSLNSALNVRCATPPLGTLSTNPGAMSNSNNNNNNNNNNMNTYQNTSHKRGQASDTGIQNEPKSPSIKTPRSPLKIHLTKSSFSLKRSPSKASQLNARKSFKHASPQGSQATLPNIDPTPQLGIPVGVSMVHDPGTLKNYVIIPNENSADSRSVSGSSQLTGTVFPAAEYNRKINAVGFQRDEPVPVQVQMMPSRETLSKYDLERIHLQQRQHN